MGRGEADAELHWRECQSALDDRAAGIEGGNGCAPAGVVAVARQLLDQWRAEVVLDLLAVVGDAAAVGRVQVGAPHVERITAERTCHVVEQVLDRQHALRSAKAAKRGGRLHVRLQSVRVDRGAGLGQLIAVVGVQHAAVVDRAGQIRRIAAAAGEHQAHAAQASGVVAAGLVAHQVVVALAGQHEVVIAVGAQLHRAAVLARSHCGDHREPRGLRLLAAEATAHPAALDDDVGIGQAERGAHLMLDIARMLGRRQDQQLPVLARDHAGDLAFEVEVLLAADAQLAAHAMRRGGQGRGRIAALHARRRQDEAAGRQRGLGIHQRRALLVVNANASRRHAGGLDAGGQHQRHRLADEQRLAIGQHRLVVQHGADGVARHIGGGQDVHHARYRTRRIEVEARDARVRARGQCGCGMQRAGQLGQVIDVGGGTGHVQVRALVRRVATDLGEVGIRDADGVDVGRRVHSPTSCTVSGVSVAPVAPASGERGAYCSHTRRSRLPAACLR